MNLKIDTLVMFEGTEDEMQNFIADFGQLLVEWGYGNTDDEIKSLIVVQDFQFKSEEGIENWLNDQKEKGAFIALPMEDISE